MEDYLSRRLAAEREGNMLRAKARELDMRKAQEKKALEQKQIVDAYQAGGLKALDKLVGNSTYNRAMMEGLAGNQAGQDKFRGQTVQNLFENVDTRTPQEKRAAGDAYMKKLAPGNDIVELTK